MNFRKIIKDNEKLENIFGNMSSLSIKGADIVFAAAGKTGEGVFQAAGEKDSYRS